nr:hypothetical protein [Methylomarinum sp. Ch1-1]MDP4521471.1 hypothetical protein [Methylomarinum sp. Ch1-1]
MAVVRIQADCLTANPPYGCDANVALTSDVLNSVKRIKNRCASYRQHTLLTSVRWIKRSGSANVERLREASRQKPHREPNWPLCASRRIAWRRIHPTVAMPM